RKPKQLVMDDGSANRAAKLVAEKRVRLGWTRGELLRQCIKDAVAIKIEYVAVDLVCPGLRNNVDHTARVQTIAGGQSTGFHAELLQRIGEGERQVHIRKTVVVVASVEE